MQISATEVARLLTSQGTALSRKGSKDIEFVPITPDSLPKTIRPEKEEIARVVDMIAKVPDTRDEIVMELKERISKGEYKVSGEEIAEMMIRRTRADNIR